VGPVTGKSIDGSADDFPLAGPIVPGGRTEIIVPAISIGLRFVPTREIRPVALQCVPADEREALESLLRSAGDRLAPLVRMARVGRGDSAAHLIRPGPRRRKLPVAAWPGTAFALHPPFPNLFLPAGLTLRPNIRLSRLADLVCLSSERLTWIVPCDMGLRIASVPMDAFHRPTLALTCARRVSLAVSVPVPDPFAFLPATVAPSAVVVPSIPDHSPAEKQAHSSKPRDGWLGRIVNVFRKKQPDEPQTVSDPPPLREEGRLDATVSFTSDSFVASRRKELEEQVLSHLPTADDSARAELWADLAETYSVGRRPAEAALGWLNAIWDSPSPRPAWYDALVRDETLAARRPPGEYEWDRWLAEPASIPTIRLAAAHLIQAASGLSTRWAFQSQIPAILRAIDSVESDLPVRLVWLARLAASAFAGGDALALARSRDAIFKRLSGTGPALDRDAPAFLRYADRAHGHREARDWVLRVREPARRWVRRMAGGGRLQRFGLDGEGHATSAYVDFLFAWAAGRHGERTAAAEWETSATATLKKLGGPVHPLLAEAFRQRIREARDGHLAGPSPLQSLDHLDEFEKFTVRRFQSISATLEPFVRRDAYRDDPPDDRDVPFPDSVRAAEIWIDTLPRRLRDPLAGERETATLIETALAVASRFDDSRPVASVEDFLCGTDASQLATFGTLLDRTGIALFTAIRRTPCDANRLVKRLAPAQGSPGDVRSAVAAAGWLAAGQDDRGLERLDACRDRLYSDHIDPRERTSLALATASALGLAPPRVALGRLEELFTRLDRIDITGSTNRFVTLKLFQIAEAAVRSAVGGESLPTPAVKAWLAADERIILSRITREANAAIG
jgi:hypothetical protein